jgi:hypothetical protein
MHKDVFLKKLLHEALDPIEEVTLQKQVAPHDAQHSDAFCKPRPDRPPKEQVPHLGELYSMTAVVCSIEGWSETPGVAEFEAMARKQFNLQHELRLAEKNPTLPMPPQWIISPGRPVTALAAVGATADPERPPGFYRSVALLGQRIVVLSELPKTADTRLLRLMGPPKMRQEVRDEIAALPEDDPTRQALLAILNKLSYFLKKQAESLVELSAVERIEMTQLGQEFEEFQANLIRTGEAKGKAGAVLAVLAARGVVVNEIVREKILSCRDLAWLDRLLVQVATADSPADVLKKAAA